MTDDEKPADSGPGNETSKPKARGPFYALSSDDLEPPQVSVGKPTAEDLQAVIDLRASRRAARQPVTAGTSPQPPLTPPVTTENAYTLEWPLDLPTGRVATVRLFEAHPPKGTELVLSIQSSGENAQEASEDFAHIQRMAGKNGSNIVGALERERHSKSGMTYYKGAYRGQSEEYPADTDQSPPYSIHGTWSNTQGGVFVMRLESVDAQTIEQLPAKAAFPFVMRALISGGSPILPAQSWEDVDGWGQAYEQYRADRVIADLRALKKAPDAALPSHPDDDPPKGPPPDTAANVLMIDRTPVKEEGVDHEAAELTRVREQLRRQRSQPQQWPDDEDGGGSSGRGKQRW